MRSSSISEHGRYWLSRTRTRKADRRQRAFREMSPQSWTKTCTSCEGLFCFGALGERHAARCQEHGQNPSHMRTWSPARYLRNTRHLWTQVRPQLCGNRRSFHRKGYRHPFLFSASIYDYCKSTDVAHYSTEAGDTSYLLFADTGRGPGRRAERVFASRCCKQQQWVVELMV